MSDDAIHLVPGVTFLGVQLPDWHNTGPTYTAKRVGTGFTCNFCELAIPRVSAGVSVDLFGDVFHAHCWMAVQGMHLTASGLHAKEKVRHLFWAAGTHIMIHLMLQEKHALPACLTMSGLPTEHAYGCPHPFQPWSQTLAVSPLQNTGDLGISYPPQYNPHKEMPPWPSN